jgi:serine/threonine-protein kinase RsbW
MDAKVHLQLENRVEAIAPVLDRVEALISDGGADEQVVFRFRLALDELITNVVMHGFPNGGTHLIGIALDVSAERVAVEVSDGGAPFDPLLVAEPVLDAAVEDRAIGGLGLHFVKQLIPELNYRRTKGLNILSLASPLHANVD